MNIGRRTQAYFVGFLIGIAIVSVLLDSRRDRALDEVQKVFTWERMEASIASLPADVVENTGATGWVTGVEQRDEAGIPTGLKGYFFADDMGRRYWWFGKDEVMKLYDGETFKVTSHPGLEWDLMKAGFEHQGHEIISRRAMVPDYVLKIDVHSAIQMADAYENLLSKSNYIASVDWVEIDSAETE